MKISTFLVIGLFFVSGAFAGPLTDPFTSPYVGSLQPVQPLPVIAGFDLTEPQIPQVVIHQPSITVTPNSLSFVGSDGVTFTQTLHIVNSDVAIPSLILSFSDILKDDDGDTITVSFNPSSFPLAALEQKDVVVTVNVHNCFDTHSFARTIFAKIGDTVVATIPVSLKITKEMCIFGPVGDIHVEITSPDNDDTVKTGETVSVVVNLENNLNSEIDGIVALFFVNEDTDTIIRAVKESVSNIDDNDDKDVTLSFTVPSSLDLDDDYTLRVKGYEKKDEETQCAEDTIDVTVKKGTSVSSVVPPPLQLPSVSVEPQVKTSPVVPITSGMSIASVVQEDSSSNFLYTLTLVLGVLAVISLLIYFLFIL